MPDEARQRYEARVRALEGLGHRGSTSAQEAKAAELLVETFAEIGLQAGKEPFRGNGRYGAPLAMHVAISAAGAALLWRAPGATLLLGLLALASLVAEAGTRTVLLGGIFRRRPSQNVVAVAPADDAAPRKRVVVLGHYDTQRTGWLWNGTVSARLQPLLSSNPGVTRSPLFLVVLAMVTQPVTGALALAGLPGVAHALGWPVLGVLALAFVLLAQWSVGRYVPGAADNASGAAAVLALAERWLAAPPPDVEAVFLATGCEESGLLGAAAWADAHRADLAAVPTVFLNIDSVGYGRPRFVGREHSIACQPFDYPPDLLALAGEVADAQGLTDAGPHVLPVFTDGLALVARGIPGLSVLAFQDGGSMPNYHLPTDTSDRMDFDVAARSVDFCWALLRRLAA